MGQMQNPPAPSLAAFNELADHIGSIHERTWVEVDVAGKTLNTAFTVLYPTGYTNANCFIGNVSYYYGGSSNWRPGYEMFASENLKTNIRTSSTGIEVTPIGAYSNYGNSKIMVELIKK